MAKGCLDTSYGTMIPWLCNRETIWGIKKIGHCWFCTPPPRQWTRLDNCLFHNTFRRQRNEAEDDSQPLRHIQARLARLNWPISAWPFQGEEKADDCQRATLGRQRQPNEQSRCSKPSRWRFAYLFQCPKSPKVATSFIILHHLLAPRRAVFAASRAVCGSPEKLEGRKQMAECHSHRSWYRGGQGMVRKQKAIIDEHSHVPYVQLVAESGQLIPPDSVQLSRDADSGLAKTVTWCRY